MEAVDFEIISPPRRQRDALVCRVVASFAPYGLGPVVIDCGWHPQDGSLFADPIGMPGKTVRDTWRSVPEELRTPIAEWARSNGQIFDAFWRALREMEEGDR